MSLRFVKLFLGPQPKPIRVSVVSQSVTASQSVEWHFGNSSCWVCRVSFSLEFLWSLNVVFLLVFGSIITWNNGLCSCSNGVVWYCFHMYGRKL